MTARLGGVRPPGLEVTRGGKNRSLSHLHFCHNRCRHGDRRQSGTDLGNEPRAGKSGDNLSYCSIRQRQAFAANRQHGELQRHRPRRLPPNSLPPVLRTRRHWSTQLNKYLNDSGRPDEFRVDPASGKLIQQVNPANGAVLGEFSVEEFPALARSVGASGLLIDSLA